MIMSFKMTTNDKLISACNSNWTITLSRLARAIQGGTVEEMNGVTIVKTGIRSPEFNLVFAVNKVGEIAEILQTVRTIFADQDLPWQLITSPKNEDRMAPMIEEMRLTLHEIDPGMVLDPLPATPPPAPGELEIREVQSQEDLIAFFEVSRLSFGDEANLPELETARFSSSSTASLSGALYLGLVDGKPAATSLRSTTGSTAGIYFVGTIAEFRRRGFGEAMTWRAAIDGRKEGCTMSCLEASEMGRSVYEKMGYKKVIEYKVWRPNK
jgi:ribosomal protein S18 acetylase RimI-like enzyme